MAKEPIYVVGHKSPDTDTVCSAIAYAAYLVKKNKINVVAAACGDLNPETKFVLDYFKIGNPEKLESVAGQSVVLVDHNEKSQSPEGIETAKIIEVIDHHKINFQWNEPIPFRAEPLGSTATLVGKILIADKFKITKALAGIIVSAILSDTVVFKSPTTTETDIKIAKKLGKIAGIKNLKKFGIEIKKQKASLKGLNAEQIIRSDFKTFAAGSKKFGVGQIEVVEINEAQKRSAEILQTMEEIRQKENLSFVALMVTDIINEGSEILASGECSAIEKTFGAKNSAGCLYVEKMMSRKKDFLPPIMKCLE